MQAEDPSFISVRQINYRGDVLGRGYEGTPSRGRLTVGMLLTGCLPSVVPPLIVGTELANCLPAEGFGAEAFGSGYLGTPLFGACTVGVVPANFFVFVLRLTSAGRPALGCIEVALLLGSGVETARDSLAPPLRTITLLFKPDPLASAGTTDSFLTTLGATTVGAAFNKV